MSLADSALAVASHTLLSLAASARGQRLTILIFHRVLPSPDPIFPGEMYARRFDDLMRHVASAYNVLGLVEACRRMAQGELPQRALCITFDDGYADNHDIALPILQRWKLPATVFVAPGFLGGGRMWNDSVIECIRRARVDHIDLEPFGLGRVNVQGVADKRKVIGALLPKIKYSTLAEREVSVGYVNRAAGEPELPSDLMMSHAQVRSLRRAGIEIGAHTRRHPILCTLSENDAREEIVGSRQDLETLLDEAVTTFAYPNGRPGKDYDETHVRLVRGAGFVSAVSTSPGVAQPTSDCHQLPRFTPWDHANGRWALRLATHHLRA